MGKEKKPGEPQQREILSHPLVFDEDVVEFNEEPGSLGTVQRTAWGDNNDGDDLGENDVEVRWIDEPEEHIVDAKSLNVIDRSLLYGDIVVHKDDPIKIGTVVNVSHQVTLKILTKKTADSSDTEDDDQDLVEKIDSAALLQVNPYDGDVFVCYGNWMGKIQGYDVEAIVRLNDGSICAVKDAFDNIRWQEEDEDITFFPTQRVKVNPAFLKKARYLKGSYRPSHAGVSWIEKVNIYRLDVYWLACKSMTEDVDPVPESPIEANKVTLFNYYSYTKISLGDVVWAPKDVVLKARSAQSSNSNKNKSKNNNNNNNNNNNSKQEQTQTQIQIANKGKQEQKATEKFEERQDKHKGRHQPPPGSESNNNNNNVSKSTTKKNSSSSKNNTIKIPQIEDLADPAIIRNIKTIVTVEWQDGTKSADLHSIDLYPVEDILDNDFCPQDFVVHRQTQNVGVVKHVNLQARTCAILWRNLNKETMKYEYKEDPNPVPVFDLVPSDSYRFRLGDIVQLLPTSFGEENATNQKWVGEIIDMKEGKLLLHWNNGEQSYVDADEVVTPEMAPQEDEDQYSDDSAYLDEDDEDQEEIDDDFDEQQDETDLLSNDLMNTHLQHHAAGHDHGSGAGMNHLHGMIENFVRSNPSLFEEGLQRIQRWWQQGNQLNDQNMNTQHQPQHNGPWFTDSPTQQQQQQSTQNSNTNSSSNQNTNSSNGKTESIDNGLENRLIIMEQVPSDFHFKAHPQPFGSYLSKMVVRIAGEIETIRNSLPPGVWLICFEDRLDLFRALISGAEGTPYQDCLFLFDLALPHNYPKQPPTVFFHSLSTMKLHPNLHTEGKVCLSLLGTWNGEGVELWDEKKSNILQVLVSIQGLILGTQHPYFLEAGFEKQRGTVRGDQNSRNYNETAFILAMDTIPRYIENPPIGLERVIREYYLKFAPALLGRCQKLLNENTNTSNNNNNDTNNNNSMEMEKTNNNNGKIEDVLQGSSDAFKKKLGAQTIPNLQKAFQSNEEKHKSMTSKQE